MPLSISRHFEDHVPTACPASHFRCGVAPKRDQRANAVATKKTDKNAGKRAHSKFHDYPAPGLNTVLQWFAVIL